MDGQVRQHVGAFVCRCALILQTPIGVNLARQTGSYYFVILLFLMDCRNDSKLVFKVFIRGF